jgi:hypothetical protein
MRAIEIRNVWSLAARSCFPAIEMAGFQSDRSSDSPNEMAAFPQAQIPTHGFAGWEPFSTTRFNPRPIALARFCVRPGFYRQLFPT